MNAGSRLDALEHLFRVLVVAPSAKACEDLLVNFSRYAWSVRDAWTLRAALHTAERFQPSLIVVDVEVVRHEGPQPLDMLRSRVRRRVLVAGIYGSDSVEDRSYFDVMIPRRALFPSRGAPS